MKRVFLYKGNLVKGITSYTMGIRTAWASCWADRNFRVHLVLTLVAYLMFLRFGIQYISMFELRQGRVLSDPLLQSLPPRDFSALIFGLIHPAIVITAIRLFTNPHRLLLGLQACFIILAIRTFCIYLVPLEPPPGMILLRDPFLTLVFGSETEVAVKDLFFSGHIATMCLLVLVSDKGIWKTYLSIATVVLAVLIAWQHVHYSIDILAAPFFAFFCSKGVEQFHERTEFGLQRSVYSLDLDDAR